MTRQHLHLFLNRHMGNFPDTQAFGKFPKYPGNWKISRIPRHLGNFRDIGGIPQMPGYLRNFQSFEKFPKS